MLVNIRQDPYERTPMLLGETSATGAWGYGNDRKGRPRTSRSLTRPSLANIDRN